MRLIACLLLLTLSTVNAFAVEPSEVLSDPALEERARELSQELRCLVCQNQSIDDSNAGLAKDLRILVRERLLAGDSNGEVLDFIVDRYGDFVLLRPPMKPSTYALWLSPLAILLLALLGLTLYFRHQRKIDGEPQVASLSDKEEADLKRILEEAQK